MATLGVPYKEAGMLYAQLLPWGVDNRGYLRFPPGVSTTLR